MPYRRERGDSGRRWPLLLAAVVLVLVTVAVIAVLLGGLNAMKL